MRLGTYLPYTGALSTPEGVVRFAQQAERLGFDHLRVGEHLVYPRETAASYPYGPRPVNTHSNQLELYTLLAFIAGQTTRLRLQSGVALIALRSPFATAKAAATLDYLSGGRFVLEVGVGWMKDEFDILNVPFEQRGAVTDETLAAIRTLFEGGGAFAGRYHQFPEVDFYPKPVQAPFPIYVGSGVARQGLRRVARYAQGWTPIGVTVEQIEAALPELRQMMGEAGRNDEALDLQGTVVVPGTGAEDRDALLRAMDRMAGIGMTSVVIEIGTLRLTDLDEAIGRLAFVSEVLERSTAT